MKRCFLLVLIASASLMAGCGTEDELGVDDSEDIDEATLAVTCATPPGYDTTTTLSGGDVGGNTFYESSLYPFTLEVTSLNKPNELAYAEHPGSPTSGDCAHRRTSATVYAYDTAQACWYQLYSSGVKIGAWTSGSCDTTVGVAVPSSANKVRIEAQAWHCQNTGLLCGTSYTMDVRDGVSWHF